jgi:hypothetical protein
MTARVNAPAAARRGAARRSTAARAAEPTEFEPLRLERRDPKQDRVQLFAVDDQWYTMPALVPLGEAMKIAALMDMQRNERGKQAVLLREVCGIDALAALYGEASFDGRQWNQLVDIVRTHALGQLEEVEAQGN